MPDDLAGPAGAAWTEVGRALEGELEEESALVDPRLAVTGVGPGR